jgi:hypothetical protein
MADPFPPPDATREEIARWRTKNIPPEIEHEVPPMTNGPSPVCNACGVVRIDIRKTAFCRTCLSLVEMCTPVRKP